MAYNKIVFGDTPVLDLTQVTATDDLVIKNRTYHRVDGTIGVGTLELNIIVEEPKLILPGKNYIAPDWATCSDAEIEQAIIYNNENKIKLKSIWDAQAGVSWADATDEQITRGLDLYYQGYLSLTCWNVGDTRTIDLSAMASQGGSYATETHAAQSVEFVILNKGGKELVTPVHGVTTCALVIGQKDCLIEVGSMGSDSRSVGWDNCPRRTWCNNIYYNAIPSTFREHFKQYINLGSKNQTDRTVTVSIDYFALAAEKEVFGVNTNGFPEPEENLSQFAYYEDTSNRIKKINDTASIWFTRTPHKGGSGFDIGMVTVSKSGGSSWEGNFKSFGIAPFGVI